MKIAYVTAYSSANPRAWSGLGSSIMRSLQEAGFDCTPIGGLKNKYDLFTKVKKALYASLRSQTYLRNREPLLLESYAAQVESALAAGRYDVIFSPSTLPIARLDTEKPVVFWCDSTFAGMVDFYPDFTHLCAESLRHGHAAEQEALSKCRLAIYSSDWAAATALENYQVDPAKVKVVPFGANLRTSPSPEDIRQILANKQFDVCRLLFLGKDWARKGGDLAVKVAAELNRRGLDAELHVVGCRPPQPLPDYVKVHGFVSKETEAGRKEMEALLASSHFLILPSRAECFGVVFAEASAYGLPSLATRVGGIPTAVRDDINGQTFDLQAGPEEYCEYIVTLISSRESYERLARSSYHEYLNRLNWTVAGKQVSRLIQEFCGL